MRRWAGRISWPRQKTWSWARERLLRHCLDLSADGLISFCCAGSSAKFSRQLPAISSVRKTSVLPVKKCQPAHWVASAESSSCETNWRPSRDSDRSSKTSGAGMSYRLHCRRGSGRIASRNPAGASLGELHGSSLRTRVRATPARQSDLLRRSPAASSIDPQPCA